MYEYLGIPSLSLFFRFYFLAFAASVIIITSLLIITFLVNFLFLFVPFYHFLIFFISLFTYDFFQIR
jgi:hypothetical protein